MLRHVFHLLRWHKIAGCFLLYWPCLWGLGKNLSFYDVVRFFVGAMSMRSAGCIVNDFFDATIDAQVERTKDRPLASKKLSLSVAFLLLIVMLSVGFCVWLTLEQLSKWIAVTAAMGAGFYPLLKRFTHYPQFFLGLIFNSGVFIGWFEHHNQITLLPFLLYCAGVCWTLSYDSAYALLDLKDDLKIGIKSTAVRFQDKTPFLILISQGFMALFLYPVIGLKSVICFAPFIKNTLITNVILGFLILIMKRSFCGVFS
jgi:4-hydroxybenzoate polyprenyltransferase